MADDAAAGAANGRRAHSPAPSSNASAATSSWPALASSRSCDGTICSGAARSKLRHDMIRSATDAADEEDSIGQLREEPLEEVAAAADVVGDSGERSLSAASEQRRRSHATRPTKLKAPSKAILFLKRAANSLTRSKSGESASGGNGAGGSLQTGRSFGSIWSLAGSARQAAGQPQQPPPASPTRAAEHADKAAPATGAACLLPSFLVPKDNALKFPLVCLIKSLEGEIMREIFVHRYELGQFLVDSLKVSLCIGDTKYFGLKFAQNLDDQDDVRLPWLELDEPVCKQLGRANRSATMTTTAPAADAKCVELYLRIKFYPPSLARVEDAFLREYLWLQLRRDLRLGKLTSSMNNLTFLMACVLQFELGDFGAPALERVPRQTILPNQDLIEGAAVKVWRTKLAGTAKHQAQMQFLRAAIILETYGFDYYPARDHQRQRAYLLGFNYSGVKTIRNGRIVHYFSWNQMGKISYERKMIIFHVYPAENSKRKQILGFKCLSRDDCLNLYMRLLEQKYFFTVDLAYFDKSVWRPSLLDSSQTIELPAGEGAAAAAATAATTTAAPLQPHLRAQQNHTFGRQLLSRQQQSSRSDESLADETLLAPDRGGDGSGNEADGDCDDDDEAADRLCNATDCSSCRPPPGRRHLCADELAAASGDRRPLVRQQSTFVATGPAARHDENQLAAVRVGKLFEWLLIGNASTNATGAPSGERASSPTGRPVAVGLAMQAVRFCLLVLLMNFVLRLADWLAAAIIDSFAFGGGRRATAAAADVART